MFVCFRTLFLNKKIKMKKTTKKIFLGLGLSFLGTFATAQDGLEKIIVEKYYISTAADTVGSAGKLPIGSVTYRVYADMLPGYRFQTLYGNSDHPLKISTTTSFFNNEDRGATTANAIASAQLKNNTVALDSWFSVGASAVGQFGVLKSEDDGKENLLTKNSLLKNNDLVVGIPLTEQDGNLAGSPVAVTFVGFDPTNGLFDGTSQLGNSFVTTDGGISALGGATGPTASNRVLIGQFTTDGVFTFELNIQIGTPTKGVSEYYVVSKPIKGEKSIPSLIYVSNLLPDNIFPEISITSPLNNDKFITGDSVNVTTTTSDKDGTVKKVEFLVDGVKVGTDSIAPFNYKIKTIVGNHVLTTIAIDNIGDYTISNPVNISVLDNQAPIVTINTPKTAITGDEVTFAATATDADGTVTQVEFFVDNNSVGIDAVAPYSIQWKTTNGEHMVKAIATDNRALTGTSKDSTIIVKDNQAPTVSIGVVANAITGDTVLITASASDSDGTVTKVEFFVDNNSLGMDSVAPYSIQWKSTNGEHKVKAVAIDNKGLNGTSKDSIIIVNDNQAPTVSIGVVAKAITGDSVLITASASDSDGIVTQVEFFVDNNSLGIDSVAPFSIQWKSTIGEHKIKAIATDNRALTGTSKDSTINVTEKENIAPVVTIGVAASAMTSDMVALTATANDLDGTVDSVQFFVDGTYLGTDKSAPYSINWNAISGTHKVKAVAIDNKGLKGTSKDSTIIVKDNVAPIITVSNPANAITGDSIVITASANDSDGTVASVEFFVDNISVGTDATSPYSIPYKTTAGKHYVKAVATDNRGLTTTSKVDSITVVNNQAPVVTITTPKTAITGDEVTFTSTATDLDGTVTQVEYFVDNVSVGVDATAPYAIKWKTTTGEHKVKAIATDNRGFTGNSADSTIKVIDNLAPTLTLTVDSIANTDNNVSISATSTDADGTVKKIEFYVDDVLIASDSIAPFTTVWKAVKGNHKVKAIAFDNRGLTTTKSDSILVKDKNVGLTSMEAIKTTIYPNPANTELTIVASENASLEIMDISGKVITYNTSLIANTTHHIAVSEFTAGVYLVRIYNDNYSKTERVVINN